MSEKKDWKKIAEEMGYEVTDAIESAPWRIWVRISSSRIRLVDLKKKLSEVKVPKYGKAPVVVHENMLNGRSRYRTYNGDDIGEPDMIEDYASKIGREKWDRYAIERDSSGTIRREGPLPFRSKKERLEYERITGQERRDPGSAAEVQTPDWQSTEKQIRDRVDKFVHEKLKELS